MNCIAFVTNFHHFNQQISAIRWNKPAYNRDTSVYFVIKLPWWQILCVCVYGENDYWFIINIVNLPLTYPNRGLQRIRTTQQIALLRRTSCRNENSSKTRLKFVNRCSELTWQTVRAFYMNSTKSFFIIHESDHNNIFYGLTVG